MSEELCSCNQVLTSVLEYFPFGILLLNEDGLILHANHNILEYFGLCSEDVAQRYIDDIVQDLIGNTPEAPLEWVKRHIQTTAKRTHVRLKTGEELSFHWSIRPLGCPSYQQTIYMLNINDPSNNPFFGKKLTLKQALLHIKDRITILDDQGRIIFCNWLPEIFVGRKYIDVVYQGLKFDPQGKYRSLTIEALETGNDVVEQVVIEPATGRYEKVNIQHLRGSKNRKVIGLMSLYSDVTAEYKLREELTRLETLGALGKLASATAHELKNALTAIRAWAQMGSLFDQAEKKDLVLKKIVTQIDDLNIFLNELTLLNTADREQLKLADPSGIVHEVIELVQAEAELKGISLEADLATEMRQIPLAGGLFKQALLNVLKNSLQALDTLEGGRIKIHTWYDEYRYQVAIYDNGHGIPKEIQEKLGTLFTTTKKGGTGLGFAITLQIVQHTHKGHVFVNSAPNKGTCVILEFPLEIQKDPEITQATNSSF